MQCRARHSQSNQSSVGESERERNNPALLRKASQSQAIQFKGPLGTYCYHTTVTFQED